MTNSTPTAPTIPPQCRPAAAPKLCRVPRCRFGDPAGLIGRRGRDEMIATLTRPTEAGSGDGCGCDRCSGAPLTLAEAEASVAHLADHWFVLFAHGTVTLGAGLTGCLECGAWVPSIMPALATPEVRETIELGICPDHGAPVLTAPFGGRP